MISILLCTYACLVPIIEFLVSCLYLYDLHFFPFFTFFFYGQYNSTAVIDLYVNESGQVSLRTCNPPAEMISLLFRELPDTAY